MTGYRFVLAALLVAAFTIVARPVGMAGPLGFAVVASAQQSEPARAQRPESAKAQEAAGKETAGESESGSGWGATIAKAFNFAILVAVLVYFLRAPLLGYLNGRIGKVREDLVTAAQTRETAERQLAEIDARLRALPAELEALKQRGAEDITAERARIEQAADTERERLLEHTRREIDMRLRVARRELLELAADRAVGAARDRIERVITPADQARLIDRYAAQLQSVEAVGKAPAADGAAGGAGRQGAPS
jgi:F-type H+-transporting ATPase subunit b